MKELVYQKKRKEQIRSIIPQVKKLCKKGLQNHFDESLTRNAIIDVVLEKGLGLKFGENLTSEHPSGQGYCDYLITYKGKPHIIIEAKKIGYKLSQKVFYQSYGYSISNLVNWIVLTDGNKWICYKVTYIKKKNETTQVIPQLVFKTQFLDLQETAANKKDRIDKLYLLSEEAQRKDELKKYFNLHQVFSSENLIERILINEVLDKIRVAIKRDTKFSVTNKELANNIFKFIKEDKIPDEKTKKKILSKLK